MSIFALVMMLLVAAPPLSENVFEFRKVDYFEVVTNDKGEPKEKKFDARLEIDTVNRMIRITDEKKGAEKALYASIPYDDVTSMLYERSVSSRAKTAILISPLALLSKSKKHWLTIEYADGLVYMRLDKKNERQIRSTLGSEGFDVEVLIDS